MGICSSGGQADEHARQVRKSTSPEVCLVPTSHAIGCDSARQFARVPQAEEPTKKESHEPDHPRLRVTPDADREGRPGGHTARS
jgi:hypothetical protein